YDPGRRAARGLTTTELRVEVVGDGCRRRVLSQPERRGKKHARADYPACQRLDLHDATDSFTPSQENLCRTEALIAVIPWSYPAKQDGRPASCQFGDRIVNPAQSQLRRDIVRPAK